MVELVCQSVGFFFESGIGKRITKKRKLPDSEMFYLPAKRLKISFKDEVEILEHVDIGSQAFEAAALIIDFLLDQVTEVETIPDEKQEEEDIAAILSDVVRRILEVDRAEVSKSSNEAELTPFVCKADDKHDHECKFEDNLSQEPKDHTRKLQLEIINELIERAVSCSVSKDIIFDDSNVVLKDPTSVEASDNLDGEMLELESRPEEESHPDETTGFVAPDVAGNEDSYEDGAPEDLVFLSELLNDLITQVVVEDEPVLIEEEEDEKKEADVNEEDDEDKFLMDLLMDIFESATEVDEDKNSNSDNEKGVSNSELHKSQPEEPQVAVQGGFSLPTNKPTSGMNSDTSTVTKPETINDETAATPSRRTRSKLKQGTPTLPEHVQDLVEDIEKHGRLKVVLERLQLPSITQGNMSPVPEKPEKSNGKESNSVSKNKRKKSIEIKDDSPKRKRPNESFKKFDSELKRSPRVVVQRVENLLPEVAHAQSGTKIRPRSTGVKIVPAKPQQNQIKRAKTAGAAKTLWDLKPVVLISAAERAMAIGHEAAYKKAEAMRKLQANRRSSFTRKSIEPIRDIPKTLSSTVRPPTKIMDTGLTTSRSTPTTSSTNKKLPTHGERRASSVKPPSANASMAARSTNAGVSAMPRSSRTVATSLTSRQIAPASSKVPAKSSSVSANNKSTPNFANRQSLKAATRPSSTNARSTTTSAPRSPKRLSHIGSLPRSTTTSSSKPAIKSIFSTVAKSAPNHVPSRPTATAASKSSPRPTDSRLSISLVPKPAAKFASNLPSKPATRSAQPSISNHSLVPTTKPVTKSSALPSKTVIASVTSKQAVNDVLMPARKQDAARNSSSRSSSIEMTARFTRPSRSCKPEDVKRPAPPKQSSRPSALEKFGTRAPNRSVTEARSLASKDDNDCVVAKIISFMKTSTTLKTTPSAQQINNKRRPTSVSQTRTKKSKVESDSDDDIEIVAIVSPTENRSRTSLVGKELGKKRPKTAFDDDEIEILSPPKKHSKSGTNFSKASQLPAKRPVKANRPESKARK